MKNLAEWLYDGTEFGSSFCEIPFLKQVIGIATGVVSEKILS